MCSTIYFDMDGCLAKWDPTATVEQTKKTGYFLFREEEVKISALMRKLKENGYPVFILTAAYSQGTAMRDKKEWLINRGLQDFPVIFVPYGQSKTLYVKNDPNSILVDDYSRNLREWENAGYMAVKFFNGINGTHGTWKGASISHEMNVEQMYRVIREMDEAV